MNPAQTFVGIFALISFVLSACAAAFAINLYALLRTGRMGASWRVLIIASVMFALLQVVRLAEIFGVAGADEYHLSSIVSLAFAVTLLYSFYLQRQVFEGDGHSETAEEEPLEEEDTISPHELYP